jgi:hypothetical protein
MENAKSSVVPIRQEEQVSGSTKPVDRTNVIQSATNLFKTYLQKTLAVHLETIEQKMFDAIDDDGMESIAQDIKVLKKASKYLSSLYIDSIVKNLSSFTGGGDNAGDAFYSSKKTEDWSGLELLATDEIENQLLLDGYISDCESRLSDVLYALQRRVENVSNSKELKGSKNPFGPSVLMNTYVELIKGESFSKDGHKVLCESFSNSVLTDLGDVLEDISELFIQANILPKLPKPKVEKSKPIAKKEENSFVNEKVNSIATEPPQVTQPVNESVAQVPQTPQTPQAPIPMMPVAEIEPAIYSSLVEMAQAYRATGDEGVISDGLVVSGKQLPTSDLIDTLTNLQKTSVAEGVNLGESVRSQVGQQIQVDGQRQPYAEQDDTLIDVVAMFFDVILQDRHLPDTVRAMIAQLQIPILKVAMMDKDFFAKKNHPARKFLNSLSQAGLGVSEKTRQIKSTVFDKMEELVARVLMDFDNDVGIFEELFEEFDVFMEQQQRQIDVIEERSRKVTKSTENLELTKRQAAYEIALRLKGKAIPEFVQLFLDDAWKDVLVLALLRREREPEETKKNMGVIERLIASVVEPEDEVIKSSIIEDLPRLLKDIKVGLENISYDFHESAPFFKELESWHRQLLAVVSEDQSDIPVAQEVVLVEYGDEICAVSLEDDLLQELESELSDMPNDKYTKLANAMQVGDWIEYNKSEGLALRAKLSWKSAVTMQCLFVDDRGTKAMDISISDFAEELRQKRISMVGQEKAPLVERVLEGMRKLMPSSDPQPSLA